MMSRAASERRKSKRSVWSMYEDYSPPIKLFPTRGVKLNALV